MQRTRAACEGAGLSSRSAASPAPCGNWNRGVGVRVVERAANGSRELLLHELGHAVGLAHPLIDDPNEIMYPRLTTKAAAWGAGDLAGLRAVGASGGCLGVHVLHRSSFGPPAR
jgi:hypothetical protein